MVKALFLCSESYYLMYNSGLHLEAMDCLENLWCKLISRVWKFLDFSIPQIFREIKSGKCRSAKSAIFHVEALNSDFNEFLHFQKPEIGQMNKIQIP